ncbi:MAG: DUF1178 family protein [Syntrophales bacterium]
MIVYDLKCANGHQFEGWFQDGNAFEEQQSRKQISCPICGSLSAGVVLPSLTVMGRDNKRKKESGGALSTQQALQMLNEFIDKNFDNVGSGFAEVAIRMHHGEEEKRNIKGTTTGDEEKMLKEEGIHFIKIPLPKYDS